MAYIILHLFFLYCFVLFSFGNSLSNTDLIFLANITVGDNPELVLGFGVTWYTLKNCRILSMDSFLSNFFNAHLKVSTNFSACPLDHGWYGAVVMYTIKKALQKILNSFAVNYVPLSDTIVSGIPNLGKSSYKNLILSLHVGFLHFITSGHFEKLSTTIKYYCPFIGPAKSICSHDQGLSVCLSFAKA